MCRLPSLRAGLPGAGNQFQQKKNYADINAMNNVRLFLIVQLVLCILLAVLLIVSVIGIYLDGVTARAENPLAAIFSREIVAERFRPVAPLFFAVVGLSATGLFLDVKDEASLKSAKGGKVENKAPAGKTVQIVLLIAAVLLIVAGVFNGSAKDVFAKAVKICTECVGLG